MIPHDILSAVNLLLVVVNLMVLIFLFSIMRQLKRGQTQIDDLFQGWRYMEPHEIRQEGDQWWNEDKWVLVLPYEYGETAQYPKQPYRRRLIA